MVSSSLAEVPEWEREHPERLWDPGRRLLRSLRRYQAWADRRGPFASIVRAFFALQHRFWSVVTGADIPLNCTLGGGLTIPHPNGIVIHPDSVVGPNCMIFQQVTLGTRGEHGAPVIGGHVDIGAGAKVLGEVTIGEHSTIGANAVVLRSFPASSKIAGVPARLVGEVESD